MAESTLSLSHTTISAAVGRYLGFGADSSTWGSAGTADTQAYIIEEVVKSGVRRFLFPPPLPNQPQGHSWSFLRVPYTLTTQAAVTSTTITVTAVDGVVTFSSGTLASWAASGVFVYEGHAYEISTRDSATQLTLVDTTLDIDDATTEWAINQQDYEMPDDFGFIEGVLTYDPNISPFSKVEVVGEALIRRHRQDRSAYSARPRLVAIRPKLLTSAAAATEGQRFEMMFWPTPDAAYTFTYTYVPLPDKISGSALYTYGGMAHTETLLEACLSVAEERENDEKGIHWNQFMERLAASIAYDRRSRPQKLGYNGDRSDDLAGPGRRPQNMSGVTYEGAYYA